MTEYIERKTAIEKLNDYCVLRMAITGENDEFLRGLKVALKAIEYNDVIPSADAQPIRRGRWEDSGNFYFKKCSECGSKWDISITNNCFVHYCPRCGARMDGDTE